MDNYEQQFKTETTRVHLLKSEKEHIRQRVLSDTSVVQPRPARYASPFTFAFKLVAASLVLLLGVGGPVTYAAQNSKPGDLLYTFELKMLEPVEASLHLTPTAQADFHTSRLEERLDELKETEAVDISHLEIVTQNIEEHVGGLATSLASSTEPKEDKLYRLVKSKALVESHEEVLEDLAVDTEPLEALGEAVEEELSDTSEEYLAQTSEEELETAITTVLDDLGELASSTSPSTQGSIQEHILNITHALENNNLEEALDLSTDIQVEVLKQEYLEDER